MRFELLFEDLASQLEAQQQAEAAEQHAEEERLRLARTTLRDRLAALDHAGAGRLRLRLRDGAALDLVPSTVGRDWVVGDAASGGECLLPLTAIASLSLRADQLDAARRPEQQDSSARIGIGVVLRELARRRVPVDLYADGEASPVHGTIDRVGADHLDLAVHERGAVRRAANVREQRVVALAGVLQLRF